MAFSDTFMPCSKMSICFSSVASISTIANHRLLPPSTVPSPGFIQMCAAAKNHHLLVSSAASSSKITTAEAPDFDSSSVEKQGSNEDEEDNPATSSNEILKRLKRYGISGILSYGLLNTAYYLTTFIVVWFYVTPAPGKMGYLAAVNRFLKVMAMVWAGSQVTKLVRAGGALALAPFVDRGLSWFTVKFGFESQGKAFIAIAGLCFCLAFLLFLIVTLLSA